MHNKKIKADVAMVAAYHLYFLFSHFDWLQQGDPRIGNKPGFLQAHIGCRYFLMHSDLVQCCNDGWKGLERFKPFLDALADLPDEGDRIFHSRTCNAFIAQALKSLEKHFLIWVNQNLHLSLFAEGPIAHVVAQFLTVQPHTM